MKSACKSTARKALEIKVEEEEKKRGKRQILEVVERCSNQKDKQRKDGLDRTGDRERLRKVRGAVPPEGGQKMRPIMERPFQKWRLQDAPSFSAASMQRRERKGGKKSVKKGAKRRDEC